MSKFLSLALFIGLGASAQAYTLPAGSYDPQYDIYEGRLQKTDETVSRTAVLFGGLAIEGLIAEQFVSLAPGDRQHGCDGSRCGSSPSFEKFGEFKCERYQGTTTCRFEKIGAASTEILSKILAGAKRQSFGHLTCGQNGCNFSALEKIDFKSPGPLQRCYQITDLSEGDEGFFTEIRAQRLERVAPERIVKESYAKIQKGSAEDSTILSLAEEAHATGKRLCQAGRGSSDLYLEELSTGDRSEKEKHCAKRVDDSRNENGGLRSPKEAAAFEMLLLQMMRKCMSGSVEPTRLRSSRSEPER